jgi:hypothetical protein
MTAYFRWTVLLGLCALAGCGGGGGGGSSASGSTSSGGSSTSSSSSTSSGSSSGGSSSSSSSGSSSSSSSGSSSGIGGSSGSNVVSVIVNSGPPADGGGTFNIPYTSVTLCKPGTTTCATVSNVLVDTGSYGLRIMASALATAGLTQTDLSDPNNAGNTLAECLPFADGYTWGPLMSLDVGMGGELAPGVTVNIIDDNGSFAPSPPAVKNCASAGAMSLNSVSAFDANGVLGVGVFDQDCGSACADCGSVGNPCNFNNDIYFTCNTSNTCVLAPVALTLQVRNPVALFAVDNNGVILTLQSIPATGQRSASGTLTFGIGTAANNALGSATVLTLDFSGNFTTTYKSQTLSGSFIDSGSNGLYFPDSTITVCQNTQNNPHASDFYCPASPQMLSAVNQGQNGTMSTVSFEIMSLNSFNGTFFALSTVGGPAATNPMLGSYFDWGLPFFYGRSVYAAITGKLADGTVGPYNAY